MRLEEFLNPTFACVFVQKLHYDLGDCMQWECMFLSNDNPHLLLPADDANEEFDEDETVIVTFKVKSVRFVHCQRHNVFTVAFFCGPKSS